MILPPIEIIVLFYQATPVGWNVEGKKLAVKHYVGLDVFRNQHYVLTQLFENHKILRLIKILLIHTLFLNSTIFPGNIVNTILIITVISFSVKSTKKRKNEIYILNSC